MTMLSASTEKRAKIVSNVQRAWKDGRILTSTQRERKRSLDRKRSSRSRRQSARHVAALETEIRRLQAGQNNAHEDCTSLGLPRQPLAATDHLGAETPLNSAQTIDQEDQSSLLDRSNVMECRDVMNSILHSTSTLDVSRICTDDEINEDALIRGITQGWKDVRSRHQYLCPLWRILRLLDSRFFKLSGTITRFCTLYMIHRMLLCLVNATDVQSLPPWYRPRPVQKMLSHSLAVDVLPWPGLRERAVLDPDLTSPNRFWNDVIYCFRFIWPFEVNEAVKVNPSSRLFHFSGMYKNYVNEISMWTMDTSWFEAFPDTVDDILPALRIEWSLGSRAPAGEILAPRALPLPLTEEAFGEADDVITVDFAVV